MSNQDNFLPPQGPRNPRGRRGRRSIVPAPPASPSCEGLVEALPTGAATDRATVVERREALPQPTPGPSGVSAGVEAPLESELGVRPRKRARNWPPGERLEEWRHDPPDNTGWRPLPPLNERFRREGPRITQWGLPPAEVHSTVETVLAGANKALDMIGDLTVAPVKPGRPGVRLRTFCEQSVQGFRELEYALGDLASMGEGEATKRLQNVERQVRGLKAALARVERMVLGLTSTTGPAIAPAPGGPRPRSGTRAKEGEGGGGKWVTVSRNKQRRTEGPAPAAASKETSGGPRPPGPQRPVGKKGGQGGSKGTAPPPVPPTSRKKRRRRRTAPRHAAVTITATGGKSYAEIMGKAREMVDPADMGIELGSRRGLTIKRARNGGYLLEVLGKDSASRADRLARELEEALSGDAKVARPSKSAEMRIVGLDDSATPEMILQALGRVGECPQADFRLGTIRRSPGGLGAVWVRCPLSAAVKVEAAGGLKVGWAFAKARLLEERPLQCYRCLRFGHLAASCDGPQDLKGRCFRCGGVDHVARTCTNSVRCLPCDMMGRDPSHRMGGRSCPATGAAKAKAGASSAGVGTGGSRRSRARAAARQRKKEGGAPLEAPPPTAGGSGIRDSGAVLAPSPVNVETSRQDEGATEWPTTQALAAAMGWTQPEGSSPAAGEQEGAMETQNISVSPPPNEESVADFQPRTSGLAPGEGHTEMESEIAGATASLAASIATEGEGWSDMD